MLVRSKQGVAAAEAVEREGLQWGIFDRPKQGVAAAEAVERGGLQ
jgi:hypothetical protein